MKRQDIIKKLVKEGLTEKTLVNMTDKQLGMLAERLLSEQYGTTSTTGTPSVVNIPKEKTQDINTAKMKKQTFATYESEVKEEEPKLGAEKKDYSDKDKAIKASNAKIRAAIKDGKDYGDYTRLIKKLNDGKLPASTEKIIHAHELNEWVNKAVEKNIHPFTSKDEIMKLIESKMNEQEVMEPGVDIETLPDMLTYDAIKGAAEPMTKPAPVKEPGTKPTTKPTPKTPYRPGPGINPAPKAVR